MGVAGLILGAFVAVGTSIVDYPFQLFIASVIVFLFVAAGNSLNDYMDREVDKRAHPRRPIPFGLISADLTLAIAGIFFGVCLVMSFLLDSISIAVIVSAIFVMLAYEGGLKRAGLGGNLSIAWLTAALFLLGGAIVERVDMTVIIAAMAFLATLGREIIKDIEDIEADFDRKTLPMRIGKKKAGMIGSAAFIAAVILSPGPYIISMFGWGYLVVVLLADGVFIYCSIVHFQSPRKGQRFAKIGMMIALAAFLIGGIQ
ncbi:MAG: UbiA family prenyltransferase [Methanomassiliicoccales archaeon]|nr:UbiA family prenyltransferase [Methanomassiliicoccales archaeon]